MLVQFLFFYSDLLCPFFRNLISLFYVTLLQMATAFLRLVKKKIGESCAAVAYYLHVNMYANVGWLLLSLFVCLSCFRWEFSHTMAIQQDWTGKMWNEHKMYTMQNGTSLRVCCRVRCCCFCYCLMRYLIQMSQKKLNEIRIRAEFFPLFKCIYLKIFHLVYIWLDWRD